MAERANDADRKARLREAAKQWADLAEQVEQLMARNPPQNLLRGEFGRRSDAVSKISPMIMDVFLIRQSYNS